MKAKRLKSNASPLYSKAWLQKRYVDERKTAKEIAEELNTSIIQVYRWLDYFQLREK